MNIFRENIDVMNNIFKQFSLENIAELFENPPVQVGFSYKLGKCPLCSTHRRST